MNKRQASLTEFVNGNDNDNDGSNIDENQLAKLLDETKKNDQEVKDLPVKRSRKSNAQAKSKFKQVDDNICHLNKKQWAKKSGPGRVKVLKKDMSQYQPEVVKTAMEYCEKAEMKNGFFSEDVLQNRMNTIQKEVDLKYGEISIPKKLVKGNTSLSFLDIHQQKSTYRKNTQQIQQAQNQALEKPVVEEIIQKEEEKDQQATIPRKMTEKEDLNVIDLIGHKTLDKYSKSVDLVMMPHVTYTEKFGMNVFNEYAFIRLLTSYDMLSHHIAFFLLKKPFNSEDSYKDHYKIDNCLEKIFLSVPVSDTDFELFRLVMINQSEAVLKNLEDYAKLSIVLKRFNAYVVYNKINMQKDSTNQNLNMQRQFELKLPSIIKNTAKEFPDQDKFGEDDRLLGKKNYSDIENLDNNENLMQKFEEITDMGTLYCNELNHSEDGQLSALKLSNSNYKKNDNTQDIVPNSQKTQDYMSINSMAIDSLISTEGIMEFKGTFKNGKLTGIGKLNYINGDKLQGKFHNNKQNGSNCKKTFANGDIHTGSFQDHKLTGEGEKTYEKDQMSKGQCYTQGSVWEKGTYFNNKLNGYGEKYIGDVLIERGQYTNDQIFSNQTHKNTDEKKKRETTNLKGIKIISLQNKKRIYGEFSDGYLEIGSGSYINDPNSKSIFDESENSNSKMDEMLNEIFTAKSYQILLEYDLKKKEDIPRTVKNKHIKNGLNLKIYNDESYYIGYLARGNRHGFGFMNYINGDFYYGYYNFGNKFEGVLYSNGNFYEGRWDVLGKFDGKVSKAMCPKKSYRSSLEWDDGTFCYSIKAIDNRSEGDYLEEKNLEIPTIKKEESDERYCLDEDDSVFGQIRPSDVGKSQVEKKTNLDGDRQAGCGTDLSLIGYCDLFKNHKNKKIVLPKPRNYRPRNVFF